ncbi:MAG TPA: M48 family metalloprotease [Vicinamibacterales bacterium]
MRSTQRARVSPGAALGLALLAACATNPVTGERQLALISEAQEIEIGREAAAQIPATIGLVDDEELQNYVARVGLELARQSERPNLPWSFGAVDDPTPNAFALPGGFIYVTRGLLGLMNSEAQLASVLGHEIGHVTARHSVTMISRQQLAQLGLGLGGILVPEIQAFGGALGAGLELLFLKYGRDAERQADELGFRYALNQNYDVREMPNVFRTLERAGGEERSALPAWLSTHPAPLERARQVEEWIAALPANGRGSRVEQAQYLNRIDGLVFGVNPRHGFFEEDTFYHPDLRFQFSIPSGWAGQNTPQAVQLISQNRDAALQLTLVSGDPDAATREFFSQQGIQAGQPTRTSINGLRAVVTPFQASTQQGVLRGLVAHIAHGGRTYQLLGFTPSGRYGAYGNTFERVIGSFRPVTDRRVLDVQPRRLDIVRLSEATTLQAFARAHDSPVPIEELALINQVEGASSTLQPGALVKRVVQ